MPASIGHCLGFLPSIWLVSAKCGGVLGRLWFGWTTPSRSPQGGVGGGVVVEGGGGGVVSAVVCLFD